MDRDKVIECLSTLVGDSEGTLTTGNFSALRGVIENQIFPAVSKLGVDVSSIRTDYNIELVQSSGGPDNPSEGRLSYIKGHLRALLEEVRRYTPQ
ncbi:MAG: hypothetical protein IIA87_04640 [Nanoarchaeota archaeon]|nr:hypothetical protein [Nanoarchaeota archaeon]